MQRPRKRKYLVNKRYQIGFIVLLCAPVMLVGIFSGFMIYRTAHATLMQSLYRSHLSSGQVGKLLEAPMISANLMLFTLSCLLALGAVLLIGSRAGASIKTIEERLLDFARPPAGGPEPRRMALWAGMEQEATREFQARLEGFSAAAKRLGDLAGRMEAGPGQAGPRRSEIVEQLAAAEAECRAALANFRLE